MRDSEEKITLTQRRSTSGAVSKLKKSKLQKLDELDEKSGSPKSVVVWVVIIISLAAASYLGLKNFIARDETPEYDYGDIAEPTVAPTPTPDLGETIVEETVLPDSEASNIQDVALYTIETQKVGEVSENIFEIDGLSIQPYTTFVRISFGVVSEGDVLFPETTVKYIAELNQIAVDMVGVTDESSGLEAGDSFTIDEYTLDQFIREEVAEENVSYSIGLLEETTYVLHTHEEEDNNMILLDVMIVEEVEKIEDDETGDEVEVTVTPTTEADPNTDTDADGTKLENKFSTSAQKIVTNVKDNSVSITKYNFYDTSTAFTYKWFLSGGTKPYPNVEGSLEDTTLTVKISNLSLDGITGNGGTGYRDFSTSGISTIKTLNASNSGNVSTYIFELAANSQYRLFIDEDNDILQMEVKH